MQNKKQVSFRVVDFSGEAVEGAFVSILRSTVAFPEISLVTNKDGLAKMLLPTGRFIIGADACGGRHGEVDINTEKIGIVTEIILPLQATR